MRVAVPAWLRAKLPAALSGWSAPSPAPPEAPRPPVHEEVVTVDSAVIKEDTKDPVVRRTDGASWLYYVLLLVAVVVLFGISLPPASHVRRPTRSLYPEDTPRYYIPLELDCIRVVSSANSSVLPGALEELSRIGLSGSPSVQTPVLDPENHKRGCHAAHVTAHRWAVESGCAYTMVVEDDVVFADDMSEAWAAVDRLFRSGRTIDTVWFGYVGIRLDPTDVEGIVHLQKPMLAHAVIYSRETSRRIVGLPPWRPQQPSILEAYDVALWHSEATRVGSTFGVYPPAAAQLQSRPSSLSLDKNGFQDWVKSFAGMRAFAFLAYGTCSSLIRLSPYISDVLDRFMYMPPDSKSVQTVYTCNTTVPLDPWY